MAFDNYQVEILHYLNPNLIWVEVVNDSKEIIFEQLGVYGILPLNAVLDVEKSGLKFERSEEWMPASAVMMKKILENADEVWFSLVHVDRRSSIFDNNIHKYGEIIIKKRGQEFYLSKELVESGIAVENPCQFHQELSLGKIKSKLTNAQTRAVIKCIENHYRKTSKSKKQQLVKKNTSIFRTGEQLQALTIQNLERYNSRQHIEKLDQKLQDLEQCKGIEESSVGRGFSRAKSDISDSKSSNRLQLVTKMKKSETAAALASTKEYFRLYGQRKDLGDDFESDNDSNTISVVNTSNSNVSPNSSEVISKKTATDSSKVDETEIQQAETRIKPNIVPNVVFGPPNANFMKLAKKTPAPKKPLNNTKPTQPTKPAEDYEEASNVSFGEVDSHIALDLKTDNLPKPVIEKKENELKQNEFKKQKLTKLSLLQNKLKQFERLNVSSESNASESSSKSTNSSSVLDKTCEDSDEGMSEIIKNLKVNLATPQKPQEKPTLATNGTKINVNPFRNIDGSTSVFVDKLVSPILLVHTKRNNKIQPVTILRDFPFGTNIHVVLKNMGVKHPNRLQTVSWSIILRGFSAFLISPPKSGKTLGYLPAVCRLVCDYRKETDSTSPKAIIVCATSKSVSEVERVSKMLFGLEEKVFACHSGMDNLTITTALLNGCDLLICTPMMLVRLVQNDLGVDLKELSTFVIDDCERIAEVYTNEIKYVLYEIKNMLKTRVHKERKVQIIAASRIWCDFLEPLAIKAPDTVICIGAFQEIILYSKTATTVDFVKAENKIPAVLEFVDSVHGPKRTVIVCRTDDEVKLVETSLRHKNRVVFSCDNNMNIHDLYNLNLSWGGYEEPTLGPILVCCDSNLVHLNVTNASYLIHYSMPPLFSTFCKRFSVLNDNYPSIFKNETRDLKVKVLMDDSNVEQFPKILNFVKRCTDNVPKGLDKVSEKILLQKDLTKVKELVPLCGNLLSFGSCPDSWNCIERHRIFKDYDTPVDWMPKNGVITFQILHYHSAVTYSARLLTSTVNGETNKYPQSYSTLSLKMGMYFSRESTRRLHGIPKVGDICAVSLKANFFIRCQVVKILSYYKNGNPDNVVIKLIDEEKFERSRDVDLYHLPDEFREVKTYVVQVRLANICPQDKDLTFSNLAKRELEKVIEKNDDLFMRGHVAISVGNCIFVDTLEACQNLSSFNEIVVRQNFKQELLNAHAIPYPDHIKILEELCEKSGLTVKTEPKVEVPKPISVLPPARWAHLEEDLSSVFLASVEDMSKFFVRLVKFESCMKILNQDISKYVANNTTELQGVNIGDLVLAKTPDDSMYERARIDEILSDDKVNCFFVDQGDRKDIAVKDLAPINEKIITQLPFQAIECRLTGVKPVGDDWTEFSINWFCDNCFEGINGALKYLYVKYFTKEKAEWTGGHKYSVALLDTNTEKDIIVNQMLVDLNLAAENLDEIGFLSEMKFDEKISDKDDSVDGYDPDYDDDAALGLAETKTIPLDKIFLKQPIRSVPLVDSDNDSDTDSWQMNRPEDFKALFMPSKPDCPSLPMLKDPEPESKEDIKLSSDSEVTANTSGSSTNQEKIDVSEPGSSKPKIAWRQNKNSVVLKILLVGIEKYDLVIEDRALVFSAYHNDVQYSFTLQLYGVINATKSRHANKGQYILVTMAKLMQRNWLSLTKDGDSKKWIVYDVDAIDASSDEEEPPGDDLAKVIKSNYKEDECSETEDEDFMGDVA